MRIEEELVSKEELDQDVGLNLLQLLGGKKLGERFAPAPESYDGEVRRERGNTLTKLGSMSRASSEAFLKRVGELVSITCSGVTGLGICCGCRS